MLDPLNCRNCWLFFALTRPPCTSLKRYDEIFVSEDNLCPGATTSGLTKASNHVGPRELYGATTSSPRVVVSCVIAAPTVIADGALPGDVTPVYPGSFVFCFWPKLPADATTISPDALARSTACTSGSNLAGA